MWDVVLARVLSGYRALYPRVNFDVTAFDARIDFVQGAFDVCFSEDYRLASSMRICRRLAVMKEILVASPTYLAQRGTPTTPDAMGEHSLLCTPYDTPRTWTFTGGAKSHQVDVRYGLTTTNSLVAREAVLNHMGIALLPASFVTEHLMRGTLIRLFERFSPKFPHPRKPPSGCKPTCFKASVLSKPFLLITKCSH